MTKPYIRYTTSGTVYVLPSESPIQLNSSTAALALQMKYFLDALRDKSATTGTNNGQLQARKDGKDFLR